MAIGMAIDFLVELLFPSGVQRLKIRMAAMANQRR